MPQQPDEDAYAPWSEHRRAELLSAGTTLSDAVLEHARAVAALTGEDDVPRLFAAADVVRDVAIAYADALFEYAGSGYPFGVLETLRDEPVEPTPARRGWRRGRGRLG